MTYFGFLACFVLIPILVLLLLTRWDEARALELPGFLRANVGRILLAHVVLALVYTTPWDNYLVATGVWSYNPGLVTGIVFGWVPIEEYTFFVVETILAGLWWLWLARHLPQPQRAFRASRVVRLVAFAGLLGAWLVACVLFFSGWKPGTYLSITLAWALPAIFPQLLFGADILWHYRRLLCWTIIPTGLYLSMADIFALRAGTWAISPAQTTGVLFFGILPLEEVVFFFITNILIGFGMTLMLAKLSQERVTEWGKRGYRGLP
jgi:lycopene cyclase domain-containing protein